GGGGGLGAPPPGVGVALPARHDFSAEVFRHAAPSPVASRSVWVAVAGAAPLPTDRSGRADARFPSLLAGQVGDADPPQPVPYRLRCLVTGGLEPAVERIALRRGEHRYLPPDRPVHGLHDLQERDVL